MANLTAREETLVALASMPQGQASPVQIVKMLFLMEKKAPQALGGANFDFVPYDYGPFDRAVYIELDSLAAQGFIEVIEGNPRIYRVADQDEAARIIAKLNPSHASYFRNLGNWIASLSFAQLVTAIYREFPEMQANSIFQC